jgi:WD40 repeat protein/serine/threonine protein kinase
MNNSVEAKPMPGDERLIELLERWEELHRQGEEISPQELCAPFPELQPEVEQAIQKLKRADPCLDLGTPGPATVPAPEQGSAGRSSPWPWVSKSGSGVPAHGVDTPRSSQEAQLDASSRDEWVPVTWKPGDVILGLYEVREVFTGGGRGLVYRIWHRGWGIDLAVKSPRPEYFRTERDKADFEEEAETWVNLSPHPHTVTCYYVRRLGGVPRVFAEYIAGGSLARWIQTTHLYTGGPDKALERILDIAIQVAWGLQQAHEHGLVHRDVKPGNILLTPEGVAKVTDFGLARARGSPIAAVDQDVSASILVSAGGMTPAFCSPEQAEGQPVSRKTDIWSWGVSVLAMFMGALTWSAGYLARGVLQQYLQESGVRSQGSGVKAKRGLDHGSSKLPEPYLPSMPPALADLLLHCFESQPEARPKDMLEIVASLQEVYEQTTGQPYPRKASRPGKALADSLNNRAVSLCDLNKHEEAEAIWEEALAAGPHHPEATYNLGLYRWRTGRMTGEALVQNLREVCTSHPGEWLPLYMLAHVYLEQGKAPEASAILQTIQGHGAHREEVRSAKALAQERIANARSFLHSFVGHTDWVSSVSISLDGRSGLSGSADRTLKYWDLSTGQCLRTFAGHADWVTSVSLSEDGQTALSGSADKTLKVWDLAGGQCLQTLQGHTSWVLAALLSADKQYALSAGGDGTLRLWELATARCLRECGGYGGPILGLAWSRDRRFALSGSRDKTLRLWDVAAGQCLRTFTGHADKVHAVSLSNDLDYALSGSADHTIKLWELDTGRCLRTLEGHTDGVLAISLSADGRYVLSGSGDRTIKWWRLADGSCLSTWEGHTGPVCALGLTATSQLALSGSGDKSLRLWSLPEEWQAPYLVSRVLPSETTLAAWTDSEHALAQAQSAVAGGDAVRAAQLVRQARSLPGHSGRPEAMDLWSSLYVRLPRTALQGAWEGTTDFKPGHLDAVTTVCLNRDATLALSGSADRTLKLWDVATGRCLRTFIGHDAEITSACFRADGKYILSGSVDRTLKLWRVSTGRCLGTYAGHTDVVSSVALTADGRYALSGSTDRTLRLWELRTGLCLRVLEGHADPIHSVSLRSDGRYALSGAAQFLIRNHETHEKHERRESERLFTSGQLKLWDVATGRCLPTFAGHAHAVTAVHLGLGGRYALSGGGFSVPEYPTGRFVQSGPIHLWEVATGRCLGSFAGHAGAVTSVCLSLDGRFALSGGMDRTLKVWDTSNGQCLRTCYGHLDAVTAVTWSADGRYALSGSADRTVKLWILDWELVDPQPADWDEGARPYVEAFLTEHTPALLAAGHEKHEIHEKGRRGNMARTVKEIVNTPLSRLFKSTPTEAEIAKALTHRGKPRCTERDFQDLLYLLGCAGYGWLRPEGVRSKVKQILGKWTG